MRYFLNDSIRFVHRATLLMLLSVAASLALMGVRTPPSRLAAAVDAVEDPELREELQALIRRAGKALLITQLMRTCFMGHALMENRNGLIVGAVATRASGHAERLAALHLVEPHADRSRPITLGADKGFDARDFVAELREINVTPHLALNTSGRRSATDGRTTRHPGYTASQRIRKRIEEAFGWTKTVAGLRKARHRGLAKINWQFTFAMAAYNLIRLPKLFGPAA